MTMPKPATPSSAPPLNPEQPVTQGNAKARANWPAWARELPRLQDPQPTKDFKLINTDELKRVLKDADPDAYKSIETDLNFMEHELLRLFREVDLTAKQQQNRYRVFQLGYIVLAAFATLFGSLQALTLNNGANFLPWFAFAETLVALLATYLAAVSGREPPMPKWLDARRKAESMRREYFRYLMNLEPYDVLTGPDRRRLLSRRAADINRGVFPDAAE